MQRVSSALQLIPGWADVTPGSMLATLQGRTTWFIGDSTIDQFYRATACFVASGHAHEVDVPRTSFAALNQLAFVRSDLQLFLPRCVHIRSVNVEVCYARANTARAVLDALTLVTRVGLIDPERSIAITNFGLHYNSLDTPYSAALQMFVQNVTLLRLQHLVWASVEAQHFDSKFGDFHSLSADERMNAVCSDRMWRTWQATGTHGLYNDQATPVMHAAGISIFDTWNDTVPLFFAHVASQGDCTHSCSPGANELRVVRLYHFLQERLQRR